VELVPYVCLDELRPLPRDSRKTGKAALRIRPIDPVSRFRGAMRLLHRRSTRTIDFRPPEWPGARCRISALRSHLEGAYAEGYCLRSDGFAASPSDPAFSFHLGKTGPNTKSPATIGEFWLLKTNFSPTGCHFSNGLYLNWRDDKSSRSPTSQASFAFDWKAMEGYAQKLCFR
jgi:hypothetical protein